MIDPIVFVSAILVGSVYAGSHGPPRHGLSALSRVPKPFTVSSNWDIVTIENGECNVTMPLGPVYRPSSYEPPFPILTPVALRRVEPCLALDSPTWTGPRFAVKFLSSDRASMKAVYFGCGLNSLTYKSGEWPLLQLIRTLNQAKMDGRSERVDELVHSLDVATQDICGALFRLHRRLQSQGRWAAFLAQEKSVQELTQRNLIHLTSAVRRHPITISTDGDDLIVKKPKCMFIFPNAHPASVDLHDASQADIRRGLIESAFGRGGCLRDFPSSLLTPAELEFSGTSSVLERSMHVEDGFEELTCKDAHTTVFGQYRAVRGTTPDDHNYACVAIGVLRDSIDKIISLSPVV